MGEGFAKSKTDREIDKIISDAQAASEKSWFVDAGSSFDSRRLGKLVAEVIRLRGLVSNQR